MTIGEFSDALYTFCFLTGGSVTSSIRSLKHNLDVGGVANSAHLYGLAADVVYDALMPLTVTTERARRLGLKLIREADHDHLQPATWEAG